MLVPIRRAARPNWLHVLLIWCGVAAAGQIFAQTLQEARLEAPAPWARQYFGNGVAASGDTLIVGAPGTAGGTPLREGVGAAHVFVREEASGAWALHTSLLGSDDASIAPRFGQSAAIDGGLLVVGAPWGDGGFADTGAAHVYERDAGGNWGHVAALTPLVAAADDQFFGTSVAISGDTIVVGAPAADSPANGAVSAGAAYVYRRGTTGVWSLEQVLRLAIQESDLFGFAVAIDGDTLAISARSEASAATGVNGDEADNSAPSSGAVYVFTRDVSGWSRQAYLKASNTGASDHFGQSIAISGDRVLVGAPLEDNSDSLNDNAGAAYLFVRDPAGTWTQEAHVKSSGGQADSGYGTTVALDGGHALLGAPIPDSDRDGTAGAVAWFARDASGLWIERGPLLEVGHVVATSGRTLVVGSPIETVAAMTQAGAAYVFTLPDTTPPVVIAPPDIELTATGPLTDVTLGTATVTDDSGEVLTATPDNAGPFPVGVTVVTWSAADSAGNTGIDTQVVTITEAGDPLDLDVSTFRATGRVKAGNSQSVIFTFKVKNDSSNTTDSGSATLVGTMDGQEIYRSTLTEIADAPGGPATSWEFPPYAPAPGTPTGVITWVLTIDDGDPDTDTATATTKVVL